MNRAEFMSRLAALLQDMPPAEREEAIQYYNDYFDDAGEGNEAGVIAALGSPEEIAKSIKAGLSDGGNGGEFTESGFHGYEQRNKNQVMSTERPPQDSAGANAYGQQGNGYGTQGNAYGQQGNGYGPQGNSYGSQGPQGGAGANASRQPKKSMSGGKIALIIVFAILLSPVWIGVLGGFFGGALGLLGGLIGIFVAFLTVGIVLTVVGAALVIAGIVALFAAPLGGMCLIGGGLIMIAVGLVFVWLMVLVVGTAIPALIRGVVNLCSRLLHRGGERA
ncbi:MAG: DUF1700 domain-containing protein [Lachnospiraceae bacterium]